MFDSAKKKPVPCKDHFLVLRDEAQLWYDVCNKCGWKTPGGKSILDRPVKFENRWWEWGH
jgi:ribosomal protein L37AE/L43A